MLNSNIRNHNTRISTNVHQINCITMVRENSIKVFGPKIWNKIPTVIKLSNSLSHFKKQYRQFHTQYSYTNTVLNSITSYIIVVYSLLSIYIILVRQVTTRPEKVAKEIWRWKPSNCRCLCLAGWIISSISNLSTHENKRMVHTYIHSIEMKTA